MRFSEFKTKLAESLPSIVDTVHNQLAANSSVGSSNMNSTVGTSAPQTSQGSVNNAVGSTGSTPSTLGQSTGNNLANNNNNQQPNFTAGQEIKMKDENNAVNSFKISKYDPATKQVTLASSNGKNSAGQPTSATYNVDDILGNIVQ